MAESRRLPDGKDFYSIKDLISAGYGSRTTIWREIKRGELPAIKTASGRVLIPRDEFAIYQHEHLTYRIGVAADIAN